MFKLSPRLFLSPRFFALPLIALAIIVALAHANRDRVTATQVAAPVIRATTCATPGKAADASCTVARDATATVVR